MLNHLAIVTPAVLRRSLASRHWQNATRHVPELGKARLPCAEFNQLLGSGQNTSRPHLHSRRSTQPIACPPRRTHHPRGDAIRMVQTRLFSLVKRQRRESSEESVWWIGVDFPTQVSREWEQCDDR
jgi:hypothetical protein